MPEDATLSAFRTPYKYGKLVLEKSGVAGAYDAEKVDCAFPFSADGRFYLMHIGFDGVGYQTGLAVSDDLIAWEKLGVVFGRDSNSTYFQYNAAMTSILRDDNIESQGELKKVNGRYLGTWHAYPNPGYEEGAALIGLAWSDDLFHWEATEPILVAEEGAAWERGGLYKSYLVEADGVYYLFYNAKDSADWPWREQTGVATSTDLVTWTRYSGNPIIANGPEGAADELFASDPFVVRKDGTWAVYYFGYDRERLARDLLALGPDPFHLTKVEEPMIDIGARGSLDETHAHKAGMISRRGDLYHFYTAVSGAGSSEIRGISVARSRPWK